MVKTISRKFVFLLLLSHFYGILLLLWTVSSLMIKFNAISCSLSTMTNGINRSGSRQGFVVPVLAIYRVGP